MRGADDLETGAVDQGLDVPVAVTGTAICPCGPSARGGCTTRSSPSSAGTDAPQLVDEQQALGGAIEDDAEIGADADDDARCVDGVELLRHVVREKPRAPIASTPSGPRTSGRVNAAGE